MSNIVTASFANGAVTTTALTGLWQYDYGQILKIEGVDLPVAYEVHFCNAGDADTITSIGDADGVVIPDQFLQNGKTIYAFIYLHTGADDGETEYKISIPVFDRAEPTDIEPTPQQESTIGQLISALGDGVEAAEEAAERGPQIVDGYWYIWDAEAGEYVNTDVMAEGEDGFAPEVTIEEIPGGHCVTITSADYPEGQSFDVMDGSGVGGGAVDSVNGQTGVVVLTASDVGALADSTTYVSSVNGSTGAVTVSVPSASSATPQALGTASAGSSADFSRADHVHAKPTYSKSDVGLGNVDNVQQYSANNPPPYPVTSVNNQTGDVSLSIPSTAGDVGAIPAPVSPSVGDFLVYTSNGWAAQSLSVWQGGNY